MHDLSFLYELFVVFCSATIVVLIFHRLKLPHIVGFLVCGILVGPHGLNLITRPEDIDVLAEIGVVLLLFTIGVEFSLAELRRIKRYVLVGGSLQVIGTAAVAFLLAASFGMEAPRAIFVSQMFALSSTAIVLSVLASRGEMDTSPGRMILGILLFQDLCVVPMMLITPLLGADGSVQILHLLLSLGQAILLIGLILVLAVFVVPKLLEIIVRVRLREILVLGVVIICIGTAWLTSSIGLSLALGAFVAGLAISESPYSHQVFAEILPFKDVFNSLFFISIGMLLNLQFIAVHWAPLILLTFGTLLAKAIIAGGAIKMLSGSTRFALVVGLGTAQLGEFSFMLAKLGLAHQLLDHNFYQSFLAVAVVTMMLTPLLLGVAPRLAQRVSGKWDSDLARQQQEQPEHNLAGLRDHAIIVGFGLNGRYLARVLKESSIPYCILELNPRTVREAQKEGEPICFGDASRLEILRLVNFREARILVITVAEMPVARRIISVARQQHPKLYIIVRTKFATAVEELYRLGATQVIVEEFEAATEIFARVLAEYDLPRNVIEAFIETIRREGSAMLRPSRLPLASIQKLQRLLAGNVVQNFLLLDHSPARGKTLAEIDLRKKTGATIIAIVRDNQSIANPSPDFALNAGDLLVLMGTHRALGEAEGLLAPNGDTN